MKTLQITVKGSGTKEEIVIALKKLLNSVKDTSESKLMMGKTFEDHTLCTEIEEK